MKDDDGTTEASAARKQPEKQIEESVESSKVSEIKNPAEQASISHSDLNKVLLGKALGPFYPRLIKWAEGLSWKKSVLVLIALTSVTELARNVWGDPTELKDFFLLVSYYRDAQHSVASQYSSDRAEAASILSQCATDQFAPLLKGYPGGMYDAWTEAQLRVALDGIATVDDPELLLWFQGQMSGGRCWCWRQHPSSEVGHIGATAWVLLAFSRMKQQPGESQIAFLLTNQHAAGWWPQYPSLDVEDNASTYATAPSVWALHELLRRDLIVKRQKIGVETAILLGRDWLVRHSVKGRPGSWKDYDRGIYGKESLGISGLVIHVLHTIDSSTASIDRDWMARLPRDLPTVDDEVGSEHPVNLASGGVTTDPTHNFTVPWLIIATVDAYPQGTLTQRARAQRLFGRIGGRGDEIRNAAQGLPWLAAELLLSMRYLQGDRVI